MSITSFNSSAGIKGLPDFSVGEEKLSLMLHGGFLCNIINNITGLLKCICELLIILSRILNIISLLWNIIPYEVFK